jgi:hypothetical protein
MSNSKICKEAWDLLKEEERTSISLSLGHNKSSWEAGEIMQKAHYKYLEIQARAEKFLKMFTQHFIEYHTLIPSNVKVPLHLMEYLNCTMEKRMSIKDTINYLEDGRYKVTSSRDRLLEETLKDIMAKPDRAYKDLMALILEFDRWNNFRILPRTMQEPSAFKRRNKSRELKHLKNLQGLPDFSIVKLVERYEYTGARKSIHVPLLTEYYGDFYYILKVEHKATYVNQLSRLGLFVFLTNQDAEEFAELISDYTSRKKGHRDNKVMNGQRFWPKFRVQMQKAINQEILNNIIPSRKFLENAYFEMELFSGK